MCALSTHSVATEWGKLTGLNWKWSVSLWLHIFLTLFNFLLGIALIQNGKVALPPALEKSGQKTFVVVCKFRQLLLHSWVICGLICDNPPAKKNQGQKKILGCFAWMIYLFFFTRKSIHIKFYAVHLSQKRNPRRHIQIWILFWVNRNSRVNMKSDLDFTAKQNWLPTKINNSHQFVVTHRITFRVRNFYLLY